MELAKEHEIDAQYIRLITDNATDKLMQFAKLLSDGKIKTSIKEILPFAVESVQKAHLDSKTGHAKGKYVIQV